MNSQHWIDRVTGSLAPRWTLKRQRARVAADLLKRHYEGAASGRRTQGWRKSSGDANAVMGPAIKSLRENARDLVRNNPFAESALSTIADHTVGEGIILKFAPKNDRALAAWRAWAETTDCDADGRHDFYGLQQLVMRTVVESGEVLVRRRLRQPGDGLTIPMQLQVIDPDFLDSSRDTQTLPNKGLIIQGIEFDGIGRRVAYWLFDEHPGALYGSFPTSRRVPAESVLHIFRSVRPGQVRGASWFAPVLLRFKDFDEFEDATLMKQKIAACLAVITSDVDGTAAPLGTADTTHSPEWDMLEPGAVMNVPPGRSVEVVQPPSVREYPDYIKTQLRAIGTGLFTPYEDLTGDYGEMPFSAARASHIKHWRQVENWRWRMLIPQFCTPVVNWFVEVATVVGEVRGPVGASWTTTPAPMVDPVNEGLAYQRNIRTGIMTWPEAVRERGYDPDEVLAEMKAWNAKLDAAGVILDSDPRQMTQAGQLQGEAAAGATAPSAIDGPAQAAGARWWGGRR